MISGALLLGKDESWQDIFIHRLSQIGGATLFFSGLYYGVTGVISLRHNESFGLSVSAFMRGILSGNIVGAYWYLYAYMGYLIALPFLRRVAKGLGTFDIGILIGSNFIFCTFLPLLNLYLTTRGLEGV